MTTNPTSSSTSSQPTASQALAEQTKSLGENAFMQLLVTQLRTRTRRSRRTAASS